MAIVAEAGLCFPCLDVQIIVLGPDPGGVVLQKRWIISNPYPPTSSWGLHKAGSVMAPQDKHIAHPSALQTLLLEAAWSAKKTGRG